MAFWSADCNTESQGCKILVGPRKWRIRKENCSSLISRYRKSIIASTGLILSAPDTGAERLQAEKPRKASGMLFILVIQPS